VRSFDAAALNYFSDPFQFRTTKFVNQLGCFNASQATIRYQRTVLCSMWVNEQWSAQCLSRYNGTSAATSQKMVCQSTCLEYSASDGPGEQHGVLPGRGLHQWQQEFPAQQGLCGLHELDESGHEQLGHVCHRREQRGELRVWQFHDGAVRFLQGR